MIKKRFYNAKGRDTEMRYSRFKSHTYGKNSFAKAETESQRHGTYGALLFDKRWLAKRAEILARDESNCVICKSKDSLQVHHRQYHFIKSLEQFKAPWDYENRLMITLCEKCHSKGHGLYKIPSIYI